MTERTRALVSVIIPTRNRVTVLPRALQSVYAQDYPNLEILVLDDASEDGTWDYIRSHHSDIRLFRFDQNHGQIAARNLMMREANGDYIVNLDDDAHFPHADTISRVAARMEAEPELGMVAFRVVEYEAEAPDNGEPEYYTNSYRGGGNCIRKAALRETGYYRETALPPYGGEESYLQLRLVDKGYRLVYFPAATVVHNPLHLHRDLRKQRAATAGNRLLIAWLDEPFPWYILSTANALVSYSSSAVWDGSLRNVLKGFYRAFMEFPRLRSGRQPVSSRAMRIYLTLSQQKIRDSSAIRALYLNPPGILEILFRPGP